VLSADGRQVLGWISNASVLQAIAHQIGTSPPNASNGHGSLGSVADGQPAEPLPGYQVAVFPVGSKSLAVGRPLGSMSLPEGSIRIGPP
jgi:hypothetical protein